MEYCNLILSKFLYLFMSLKAGNESCYSSKFRYTEMKYFILIITFYCFFISVQTSMVNEYIPNFDQEIELFEGKELWFSDGNGNPVQAIIEPFLKAHVLFNISEVIIFELHTRKTGNKHEILSINDKEALVKSQFDRNKPTRFFAHGWRGNTENSLPKLIRDVFLEREDCNIILIDWSQIGDEAYTFVKINMPSLGKHVAEMIDFLAENGMNMNTTTLIGHSLGAHVIGLAGSEAKNKANFAIGLDPAWPLYAFCKTDCRISRESARTVEIIHTNGGLLGNPFPIGNVDFYPNGGGRTQPGCNLDLVGSCAHSRSVELYAESILTEIGFFAIKCKSYKLNKCNGPLEIMGGIDKNSKQAGIYYLKTRGKSPFALGNIYDKKIFHY